jgi:diguanylate cyclase (GGDEF)-like protein
MIRPSAYITTTTMANLHRRRTDLSSDKERRAGDRRARAHYIDGTRFPSLQEQALQFVTRYLFAGLGLLFFNYSADLVPRDMTSWQINAFLLGYIALNTVNFFHAWRKPVATTRYHFALWVDIVCVSVCVANDPYDIPPSLLAFIVVVLGNGMRYGMRFFAEALWGSLAGGALAMAVRYIHLQNVLSPGTVFLSLFGAIIVVYAYILMGRVERARRRSEDVSRTDALTGLLNRRGLFEAGDRLLRGKRDGRALVVMFADLDNFKAVNDAHGHAVGDRVLREIAELVKSSVRPEDLVARYGGDEFVLLLPDTTLDEADGVANRVQTLVRGWSQERSYGCGVSVGLGAVPEAERDLLQVLEGVDRILYSSKSLRRQGGVQHVEILCAREQASV